MHKSFSIYLAFLLIMCPVFVCAQGAKTKVATAVDLPRFSYDVPVNLTELMTGDAAYKTFAAEVRADLETVLRDYDIEDKTTLKEIQTTLAELDVQDGKLDSAFERFRLIRELEEKSELIYLPVFFDTEIIAKAQNFTGATSGEKYLSALRQVVAETLGSFSETVFQGVKEFRFGYDLYNDHAGLIKGRLAPKAKQNGNKLFNKNAYFLIGIRSANDFVVPVAGEFAKGFDAYIAAQTNAPKVNIWTDRDANLDGRQKLSPVIVAVWDTGVDGGVFPNRMLINRREKNDGKDNDRNGFADDVYGIGFDSKGKYTFAPLMFIKAEDSEKYAGWIKERRVQAKLLDAVDDDETRALKKKFQSETPAETAEMNRINNIFSHYVHGTQAASIVVEGNPAARILNARSTWLGNSGQPDSVFMSEDRTLGLAANIKAFVDCFKKQNFRVVNISWHMSRKEGSPPNYLRSTRNYPSRNPSH